MKLIEVIAGVNTPDETVSAIKKISEEIGKTRYRLMRLLVSL